MYILLGAFCGIFLVGGSVTEGAIVRHTFEVYYVSGSPDGVNTSNILAINGQFPGPTIEAIVGDTIEVTLVNKIQNRQNVTIHWHGMLQKGTLFEDGTNQISQCPLPYGHSQVYRFQVTQPGTYWYHSHVRSQYTEGLLGALIVHAPKEHYHSDGELTLILHDWYHRTAEENEEWYLSPASEGLSPYPDSGLMNGFGRYPCHFATLQNRSCSAAHQLRQVFTVEQNATYRVRIINAAAMAFFNFSIDGHILEAIEVDGVDVAKPIPVHIASLAPGQRYSFLVRPQVLESSTTSEEPKYLIRSVIRHDLMRANSDTAENINKYTQSLFPETTAVLHPVDRDLSGAPHRVLESLESFTHDHVLPPPSHSLLPTDDDEKDNNHPKIVYLNELDLLPSDGIPAPDHFDHEFVLNAGTLMVDNVTHFVLNNTPFHLPEDKPLLFHLLEEGFLPPEARPLEVENGSVVQIVLNSRGSHPFHLHGHHFWVVGMGQPGNTQSYDPSRDKLYTQALKRDTIVPQGWAVIRFVADNPGIWTLHCHIDWHNLSGMAVTIVEGADVVRQTVKPTEEALRVCRLHEQH